MKGHLVLLAVGTLGWVAAFASYLLGAPLAGTWPLSLYHVYSLAAFGGWLVGNLFVRGVPAAARRNWRLVTPYLAGPPSLLFVLWALAPRELHAAAPLVPVFAFGVYIVLFMVPVSFGRG